jgi:predicted phage terminase large subunit-like protein
MGLEGWKDLKNIGIEYGVEVRESEKTIITTTGGSVSIRSADNPDRMRGSGLDFAVLDEYAFMKPNVWAEIVRPMLSISRGGALFISTPKGFNHFEEIYNVAGNRKDWERWNFPTSVNPLISEEELESAKEEIGSYLYSQEYLAQFVEFSGGIFQDTWFKRFRSEEVKEYDKDGYLITRNKIRLNDEEVYEDELFKFATVDLATSTKEQADYTAMTIVAKTPKNNLLVLDVVRQRLQAPDIIPMIKDKVREHDLQYVGIEKVGFQLALIQIARKEGLIIRELRADRDKINRALPLSAKMEGGQIYFKAGAMWYDDLQREMLQFPEGEHDDQVDALSYAVLETDRKKSLRAY